VNSSVRGAAVIASIPSSTLFGVEGRPVSVEVHVAGGLPTFTVVGLPDASCRESRDRLRAAFDSSRWTWPMRRVTVNLAPSGVRKGGAGLDLPIAIGVLVATGELQASQVAGCAFIGELGLDGALRPVPGLLPMVDALAEPVVVVPPTGVAEAALVGRHRVRAAATLVELVACLRGRASWRDPPEVACGVREPLPDLADLRGQRLARWAAEVAAAGGHHLLLIGPPGAGKTMLARRIPGLLPPLDRAQALEVTRIHSAAGLSLPPAGLIDRAPFRAPHHSSSMVSLVGGGTGLMRPGEISLATNGVLFLDEMGEFPSTVLDSLRQPLEEGVVRLSRARAAVSFPARFLLVAAMNPCPCGEGGPPGSCRCSDTDRARYGRRLSGPLLDRFDLRVPVDRPEVAELMGSGPVEGSAVVAQRVAGARELSARRGARCNAEISSGSLDTVAGFSPGAKRVLEYRLRQGGLSARGLHRVQRVARTLADLERHHGPLDETHVCGALELRADLAVLEGFS
jgi:magnesium chelatase family protein